MATHDFNFATTRTPPENYDFAFSAITTITAPPLLLTLSLEGDYETTLYRITAPPLTVNLSLSGGYSIPPRVIVAEPLSLSMSLEAERAFRGRSIACSDAPLLMALTADSGAIRRFRHIGAPPFIITTELDGSLRVKWVLDLSLLNAIRYRADSLRLVNALATDVNLTLRLPNNIEQSVSKLLRLKMDLEELAQVSKSFRLRNMIEGGYSAGEYVFDEAHDVD